LSSGNTNFIHATIRPLAVTDVSTVKKDWADKQPWSAAAMQTYLLFSETFIALDVLTQLVMIRDGNKNRFFCPEGSVGNGERSVATK